MTQLDALKTRTKREIVSISDTKLTQRFLALFSHRSTPPANYPQVIAISDSVVYSPTMTNQSEPATLADLDDPGDRLIVFCRPCNRWEYLEPSAIKIDHRTPIPAMKGRFRCTVCNGRDTYAEPRYAVQLVNRTPQGRGWIMPPE